MLVVELTLDVDVKTPQLAVLYGRYVKAPITKSIYNLVSSVRVSPTSVKMLSLTICLLFASFVSATLTIEDPSDTINPAHWAEDNARLADYKDVTPILYQIIPVVGPYVYNDTTTTVSHQVLTVDANDTSTIVITDGAKVNIDYSNIVKFGYASNLLQSSFFGTFRDFQSKPRNLTISV